jgi:hypothetical protein
MPREAGNIKFNIIGNNIAEDLTSEMGATTIPLPKSSN